MIVMALQGAKDARARTPPGISQQAILAALTGRQAAHDSHRLLTGSQGMPLH